MPPSLRRNLAVLAVTLATLLAGYVFVYAPTERQQMMCQDAMQRRQQVTTLEAQGRPIRGFDLNDANNAVYAFCQP
jgi:hypothetical protein